MLITLFCKEHQQKGSKEPPAVLDPIDYGQWSMDYGFIKMCLDYERDTEKQKLTESQLFLLKDEEKC